MRTSTSSYVHCAKLEAGYVHCANPADLHTCIVRVFVTGTRALCEYRVFPFVFAISDLALFYPAPLDTLMAEDAVV